MRLVVCCCAASMSWTYYYVYFTFAPLQVSIVYCGLALGLYFVFVLQVIFDRQLSRWARLAVVGGDDVLAIFPIK